MLRLAPTRLSRPSLALHGLHLIFSQNLTPTPRMQQNGSVSMARIIIMSQKRGMRTSKHHGEMSSPSDETNNKTHTCEKVTTSYVILNGVSHNRAFIYVFLLGVYLGQYLLWYTVCFEYFPEALTNPPPSSDEEGANENAPLFPPLVTHNFWGIVYNFRAGFVSSWTSILIMYAFTPQGESFWVAGPIMCPIYGVLGGAAAVVAFPLVKLVACATIMGIASTTGSSEHPNRR